LERAYSKFFRRGDQPNKPFAHLDHGRSWQSAAKIEIETIAVPQTRRENMS